VNEPRQRQLIQAARPDGNPSAGRPIEFRVNGVQQQVIANPVSRLTEVLREQLRLTGTKVGCDAGDCGACTVLLDGSQICACLTAAGQVAGRDVVTVEGLAVGGEPSALQRAFLAHGAAQCGACTPGMLMAATELLRINRTPSEEAVLDALGGVLCRCTGYQKIVEAVMAAACGDFDTVQPRAGAAVGSRIAKLDGAGKVSGSELYGADQSPSGSLWLRVVRSRHARAEFHIGDLEPLLRKHPGLSAVLTAADVPQNSFGIFPQVKDQPVLAPGHVRFCGEAVLALVGERSAVMAIAEAELPIEWIPQVPVTEIDEALRGRPPIHSFAPDNVLIRGRVQKGDVDSALAAAPFVAEGTFTTSYVEHAYIEPEAGYAERVRGERGQDRIQIFSCTQTPYMDREEIARILQLRDDQVRIVPSAIGGGFGGKLDIAIQPLLAVAAWKLNRPVRGIYTRPESMLSTTKRHPARMHARFGCDERGRLLAADFVGDFNTGAYASWGNTVANRVPIHASGPYFVPHVRALTRAIYTNGPIAGAFRGFGVPQSTVVHEALLDELADQVGIDRLDLRWINAIRAGQSTATGQVLSASCGLAQCLDRLRSAWNEAQTRAAGFNACEHAQRGSRKGRRRGVGIAAMWYGIGNTVIANPSTMRVGLRRSGRIVLYNGAIDIGQGSSTILPQICADAVGLPVHLFDQVIGDTDLTADAGKTSASRQTFVSGNACRFAGEDLRRRLISILGASADAQLDLEGSQLRANSGDRSWCADLHELAPDEQGNVAVGQGFFDPPTTPLDRDGQGAPYATYGFAAQTAEVEVDLELGTVKVLTMHAAHDVGRAINPTQVEGQIHGGIAQGLGMALMEEYHSGRTDNLHDYLIPTAGDMPRIVTYLVEDAEPLGPFGAKGVGEPALIPTAPAILNAIRHATGIRITHLPATPARIRQAILKGSQT